MRTDKQGQVCKVLAPYCSAEEMAEILSGLRTLATADSSLDRTRPPYTDLWPANTPVRKLLASIEQSLSKVNGRFVWGRDTAGLPLDAQARALNNNEVRLGTIIQAALELLFTIRRGVPPDDCGAKLLGLADELEALATDTRASKPHRAVRKRQKRSPGNREKPWDPNRPGFILLSEAKRKYCDGVNIPSLGVLGRDYCKPSGEFDYSKHGRRCAVDENQFKAFADSQGWNKEAIKRGKALVKAWETSPEGRKEKLRKEHDIYLPKNLTD